MSKADKLTCPHCSGVLDGKISQALVENATYTMTIKPGPDGTLIQAHTLGGVIQELGNLMAAIWNDIASKVFRWRRMAAYPSRSSARRLLTRRARARPRDG